MLVQFQQLLLLLISIIKLCQADDNDNSFFQPVSQPSLNYKDTGNRIGLLGSFDALSFYSFKRDVSNSSSSSTSFSNSLYLQDITNNYSLKFADINGQVNQLFKISNDSVVLNGNFTLEVTKIFSDDINGSVKTIFLDNDLIYLGGNFKFNNTYSAAVYNITAKKVHSTPFQGFGPNSSINSIAKVLNGDKEKEDNEEELGSILFGGQFDTLGLSDLLVHNITSNNTKKHNTSNTSIISAEQLISLRHGTFTSVNGESSEEDAAAIVCPSDNKEWAAQKNSGAEWKVELPDEMKGIHPTKARIYIPEGPNGIKLFRIYSYPNNGIMNLTYIDPATNELAYCDAWCPLLNYDDLNDHVDNNILNATELNENNSVFVDEQDGSYFQYYDPSTKTKNLGYASNFQEFAFVDNVGVDTVGVTIIDWYGDQGILAGFELYQNAITVYGNDSLNDPNCQSDASDDTNNNAVINSVTSDTNAKITLYPNISYSGNYSIIMMTPGCAYDGSCARRAIVNVTVVGDDNDVLSTKTIYQNNENNKFDYLFYGHLNGSKTSTSSNRIEISYMGTVTEGVQDPYMVVDKNSTNHTRNNTGYELAPIKLNGLFEYSLANFSQFDEQLVHYKRNNKTYISLNNTFVGNSSINLLSGELSNQSRIDQISLGPKQQDGNKQSLLLLGKFESDSKNITLSNNNLITLTIDSYNNTLNETNIELPSRLTKRDTQTILGAIGDFALSGKDGSSSIKDLSNNNQSVSSANNFALYSDDQWYSFGNDYTSNDFNQFTNLTLDSVEYYVFSGNGQFRTWDNDNFKWVTDPTKQLNLTQAAQINDHQQILGGTGFSTMQFQSVDQAYIADGNFSKFGIDVIANKSFMISNSYYVNSSLSVIGGKFETKDVKNVGLISNSDPNNTISALQGSIVWGDNTLIQSLYVDSSDEYLFMGVNGSVQINEQTNVTGIVIYDLVNNTFTSFQPAELSHSNGDPISVNSMVLFDKGNKLLVGGDFDLAGSLSCPSLCVYDITNTRWINPQNDATTTQSIGGVVTDMKFFQSNQVLITGNGLQLNGNSGIKFLIYNFNSNSFSVKDSLNKIDQTVEKFILNDENNKNLDGRMIAFGEKSISGFDGSNWQRIDSDIIYENFTKFNDMKLLTLDKPSDYNQTYFDKSQIFTIAGVFRLKDYGLVNMALFNGTSWIPYVFTSLQQQKSTGSGSGSGSGSRSSSLQIGQIQSILIDDSYRFQSSDDLKKTNKNLSRGKVVGISLACALGSTTLLGLLYIIPYFALFKNRKDGYFQPERIHEDEMMDAVNPEDLLHEIDLQREK
ncbi:Cortical protein marker for cell polarity family protein [Candida albicans]|uniref:Cortical protein marker for cell polarity family protein n=1 Tax=Candida albicans TaxID=5476 RepID=A0A8H6F2X3_CANAX|nr:Cortical protein marker for cell polarity family protein [Candida albicans]